MKRLIVIGGGAAGFFGAINAANSCPGLEIIILEKSSQLLGKVKISGGGRCNVTHACFEPKELATYYPRGSKELWGPFHKFQPGDTIQWFLDRGIELKTESDGRMFPISNSSQTIIDCFLEEAAKFNIKIEKNCGLINMRIENNRWLITTTSGDLEADAVLMSSGSSPQIWSLLATLGHSIVPPVPSLFTMNIADDRISQLPGLSSPYAEVQFNGITTQGPVLVTHWGLSGPAILKMSSVAAIEMHKANYHFDLTINWDARFSLSSFKEEIKEWRLNHAKKNVLSIPIVNIPNQLWKSLLHFISPELRWADLSNEKVDQMAKAICACTFSVTGKSTFKEEFVTAGGVDLSEVDFRTMESRIHPNLYFAGEVLNIDAVTGGFNFQAAWTEGYIAAMAIAKKAETASK